MTDDPKLQMARRAADKACEELADFDPQDDPDDARIWLTSRNAALAAIEECTERAAKLAETNDGYNDVTGLKIARLLRSGDHLKGLTDEQ